MAKKATVELVGLNEVEWILNKMPKTFQGRVINAALKEASKPLFAMARISIASAAASVGSGGFAHLIRQVSRKQKGIPGQEIGAMPTKRKRRNEAVWDDMGPYWLEFGTMELMTKAREPGTRSLSKVYAGTRTTGSKKGIRKVNPPPSKQGRIPAMGWLRKAVDATDEQIENKFRVILWEILNKKLLTKAGRKIKWSRLP